MVVRCGGGVLWCVVVVCGGGGVWWWWCVVVVVCGVWWWWCVVVCGVKSELVSSIYKFNLLRTFIKPIIPNLIFSKAL